MEIESWITQKIIIQAAEPGGHLGHGNSQSSWTVRRLVFLQLVTCRVHVG